MSKNLVYENLCMKLNVENSIHFCGKNYDVYDFCLAPFTAKFHIPSDEGHYSKDPVLSVSGVFINRGTAVNHSEDIIDICDADSQELYEIAELFFSEDFEKTSEMFISNIIYVEKFEGDINALSTSLFLLDNSVGHLDLLVSGTTADLEKYGFVNVDMPHWKPCYKLSYLNNSLAHKDFPIDRPTAKIIQLSQVRGKRKESNKFSSN